MAAIGITITVSDRELKKVNEGLKQTDETAKKAGKSGDALGSDFKKLALSIGAVYAAVQLARSAMATFESLLSQTLSHRFADDGIKRSILDIQHAFASVNNAAFDTLAPLFRGIANALVPVSKAMTDYLKTNRELVSIKVIEWAVKGGTAIAEMFTYAAKIAGYAFLSLRAGWQSMEILINGGIGGLLSGFSKLSFSMAGIAKTMKATDTAKEWAALGFEAGKLGIEFSSSQEQATNALRKTSHELDTVKSATDAARKALVDGIATVGTEAMKSLGVATHSTAMSMDEIRLSMRTMDVDQLLKMRLSLSGAGKDSELLQATLEGLRASLRSMSVDQLARVRDTLTKAFESKQVKATAHDLELLIGINEMFRNSLAQTGNAAKAIFDASISETEARQAQAEKLSASMAADFHRINQAASEVGTVEAANAAWAAFLKGREDLTAQARIEIEKELGAMRAAAASKAVDLNLQAGGLSGLMDAWKAYYAAVESGAVQTGSKVDQEIVGKLTSSTEQMAQKVAGELMNIAHTFISEIGRIGDIETETRQRIAVKSASSAKGATDQVVAYLDNVSEAQIRAYEAMGQKVEVVSDTISIRTRTAGDAIVDSFKSVLLRLGDMIVGFLAQAAVMTLFSGGSLGFVAAFSKVIGLASGGRVNSYAAGGVVHAAGGYMVRGGSPGRDSVPILAMPGERVLSPMETRNYESGRAGGQAAPAKVINQTIIGPPSRAHLRRIYRDTVEPDQRLMRRYGYQV